MNPLLLTDFYKTIHHKCYAEGITKLVSYWCPRMTRKENMNEVVMFGLQGFIKKYLIDVFNKEFFNKPKDEIILEYRRVITYTMGEDSADTKHIEELHDLGYLPIEIKALDEGSLSPIKVPMIQITNTHPNFAWLVNYLETLMSCHIWQPMTSATISHRYREIVDYYYDKTVDNGDASKACGDFSMRGMSCLESAESSSAGHLLSFKGTATIPSILYLEKYYNCELGKDVIGLGTPSTEHSIMCSYGRDNEFEAYKRLINEVYPSGVLSIVSDTYDYWGLIINMLPKLKNDIMNRDGKIVIRGDSGDPVKIICGSCEIKDLKKEVFYSLTDAKLYFKCVLKEEISDETPHGECGSDENSGIFKFEDKYYKMSIEIDWNRYDKQYYYIDGCRIKDCEEISLSPEQKGTVELLWDIFGGTVNSKGYKVLDAHIGTIYGDSITVERCEEICRQLESKGFAVSNMTFGIGSYSFQYNTRDSFGFAMKATHSIINGEEMQIYKDPKTDKDNFKKSQKGMCVVYKDQDNKITYKDELNIEQAESFKDNLLETVFRDGKIVVEQSLQEIRDRLNEGNF